MKTVLQKKDLVNGYYYGGYLLQNACAISAGEQIIVCMWDKDKECFWFWDYENNRKTKSSLKYLGDIDDEIQIGFVPIKIAFPNDGEVIE